LFNHGIIVDGVEEGVIVIGGVGVMEGVLVGRGVGVLLGV
jgi:hypothetical protein